MPGTTRKNNKQTKKEKINEFQFSKSVSVVSRFVVLTSVKVLLAFSTSFLPSTETGKQNNCETKIQRWRYESCRRPWSETLWTSGLVDSSDPPQGSFLTSCMEIWPRKDPINSCIYKEFVLSTLYITSNFYHAVKNKLYSLQMNYKRPS